MRIPPHSLEAEQSLLGGLMLDENAWYRIEGLLSADDFYRCDHQLTFAAIAALAAEKRPMDIAAVADRLGDSLDEVGGYAYLAHLNNVTPTSANIEHYAQVIADHARKRQAISTLNEQLEAAYQAESANAVIDATTTALSRIESVGDAGYMDRAQGLSGFLDHLDETWQQRQEGKLPGVPTGLERFDRKFGGLHGGDLIVLAGRPSMGKSAMAHTWQFNQAQRGYTTAIHSLEMPDQQLNQRWIAMLSGVPVGRIKNAELDEGEWRRVVKAHSELIELPMNSHDKPVTPAQITRQARRLQQSVGLDVLYIDYLQIVRPDFGESREQQVSSMSRAFKDLAMMLGIPVVLVAQLNRGLEHRADKRPLMADLRESGQIEQDADVIAFLYRDAVYNDEADPTDAEVIVRKNRQGEPGMTRFRFLEERTMFANAEWRYEGEAA